MTTDFLESTDQADDGAGAKREKAFGFWMVAAVFLALTALSTAPSPLYSVYAHRDGLSSLTVTAVYGVYAAGIVVSLLLVGHVSDWYGRRVVLVPSVVLALAAALVLALGSSLPCLVIARVLTGLALGAAVATATAYLSEAEQDTAGEPSRRSQIVATVSNIGGLGIGALVAGILAQFVGDPLSLPFIVFTALLLVGTVGLWFVPEFRTLPVPRPKYRPQRLGLPTRNRAEFTAAIVGIFFGFATVGLISGLAGVFLSGPLHRSSVALAGLVVFITFAMGCTVQIATMSWSRRALTAFGVVTVSCGMIVLVCSAWVSPPSLTLFLIGAAVMGGGSGAIFRSSLSTVFLTASPDERATALSTFFVAGYLGLSVPVISLGFALQWVTPKVALLGFALVIGVAIWLVAPFLMARPGGSSK
jgi:MFS family permease